jgi:hypothetical protein
VFSTDILDELYLESYGLPVQPLLVYMNAHSQSQANPAARDYAEQFATFTGRIDCPVLTLHSPDDGLAPAQGETLYGETVAAAGRQDLLYQAYGTQSGHANITVDEFVAGVNAMCSWVQSGARPTAASFPSSLFQPADYNPGAWPFAGSAPIAVTGGPYGIQVGSNLTLNGLGVTTTPGSPVTYSWDLNNDGHYGDAVGATPTVSWSTLQSLGLTHGRYAISLRVTQSDGSVDTTPTTLTVWAPTDLALSASSVPEHQPVGTIVGTFSTANFGAPGSFTYTLVGGAGSTDNASFTIDPSGDLKTAASFDFRTKSSYSIRVRSTDSEGVSIENVFTITVTPVNEPPTIGVPGAQLGYENVDLALGGISVGDLEGNNLTVTLSVGHGTLTLGTMAGLSVTGNGTASVTLSGSIANLNATLATLIYRGTHDYSGPDLLSITASDGSLCTSASVALTVESIAQQAADLQARVDALRLSGVLNQVQANSLRSNLNGLLGNVLDKGIVVAVRAFLNQVTAYLNAGILTQAQANTLLGPGNILLLSVLRH